MADKNGTFKTKSGDILYPRTKASLVSGLGTAATKNTGTSSGNIPVLDSNGKLSTSIFPSLNYLPKSGGAMTGNISFQGTNSTNEIIKFKNNTSDAYGNGIAIGGGGIVIIGAGESSDLSYGAAGDENLYLAADTSIHFYSNAQSGLSSAKHMEFNNSGNLLVPGSISEGGTTLANKYQAKGDYLPLTGGNIDDDFDIYTGTENNLSLGTGKDGNISLTTGNGGFVSIYGQSGVRVKTGSYYADLRTTDLTANKTFKFPNATNATETLATQEWVSSSLDNYLLKAGGEVTGELKLYTASGDSPRLTFQRGTLTDGYNDWSIYDSAGILYIQQRGSGSSSWETRASFSQSGVSFAGSISEGGTSLSDKYQAKGTYAGTAVATTSANGLMSSTDKTRLNSIWNVWSADGTDDTLVNKVEEVLTVFNNFPESSNLVELLAAKVPTSRTINTKPLNGDITLTYSDVGAASSSHEHTLSIGNGPASPTYTLNPGTSYNLNAGGKTISFKFYGDGNTCNTAGISKKASTKLYLIGSESFTYGSATDAGTTYVNDGVYVDTDNALYVGGEKVVVTSDSRLSNARTPTAHASSATTYGVGTSSNYGHVKLGAANQNGATAADGVAAPNGHTHSQYVTSSGVTSVATSGTGLSGGTITSTGTITLDSSSAGNAAANKVVLRNAAGSIQSEKLAISSGTTTKATMQYNSTEDCIEFVFA